MKNKILVSIILCFALLTLVGCQCDHSWNPATCTAPAFCSNCGETGDEVLSHTWADATCTLPKTCTLCGATEGSPLSHVWADATCISPQICSLCGQEEGTASGHKWNDATCSAPKTCSVCNAAEGEALPHTWADATCTLPQTCSICNATEGNALGHTVTKTNTTKEATCTETGIETGTCDICGEEVENELDLLAHSESDWEITVTPTATEKGTRVRKCTVCGKELSSEQFKASPEELEQIYKDSCETISYGELERKPGEYKGKKVKFSGRVVQVCSESDSIFYYSTYRVATKGKYDNVVYLLIDTYGMDIRILEGDRLTFYGEYNGIMTYESVRGDSISIPKVTAEYVDF